MCADRVEGPVDPSKLPEAKAEEVNVNPSSRSSLTGREFKPDRMRNAAEWLSNRATSGDFDPDGEPRFEDEDLYEEIERAFRRHQDIDRSRLVVDAHGSDVLLAGEVDSEEDRMQVISVVTAVDGVRGVEDEIRVNKRLAQ